MPARVLLRSSLTKIEKGTLSLLEQFGETLRKGREPMLVNEMIRRGARYYANETAVLFGDERLTYREVDERSSGLAHALIAQGLKPHDRIGLLLNNSQNSVLIDFACLKARLTRVP